jgi:hypothetical protein
VGPPGHGRPYWFGPPFSDAARTNPLRAHARTGARTRTNNTHAAKVRRGRHAVRQLRGKLKPMSYAEQLGRYSSLVWEQAVLSGIPQRFLHVP